MTEVGDEFFVCPDLEVRRFRGGVVALALVDEICGWMFECWSQCWYCAVAVVVVVVTVLREKDCKGVCNWSFDLFAVKQGAAGAGG